MATASKKVVQDKAKAAGMSNPGLKIVSRSMNGFRRHGHTFTPTGKLISYDDLTDEQVEAFSNEPQLVTAEVDIDAEARRMAGLPPLAAS